jgi:hypothetical protein
MTMITVTSPAWNFNGLHAKQFQYAHTDAYHTHQPVTFLSGFLFGGGGGEGPAADATNAPQPLRLIVQPCEE